MTWKYENLENLATSGIYSQDELTALRNIIMFPIKRPAVLNDFVRELHGGVVPNKDSTLLRLFNDSTIEKIVDSY